MGTVDCRGMSCPQPVLETKKALAAAGGEEVCVLVDNPGSKENVRRFAESQGYRVETREEQGAFAIRIRGQGGAQEEPAAREVKESARGPVAVFLDSDSLGRGSEELGRILMRAFLHTLGEAGVLPGRIILVNSGVKLACQGSDVLEDLGHLAARGAEVLACGTCLDFFGLKSKLQVGRVSNMYEILSSLEEAEKVLKI